MLIKSSFDDIYDAHQPHSRPETNADNQPTISVLLFVHFPLRNSSLKAYSTTTFGHCLRSIQHMGGSTFHKINKDGQHSNLA
jgi:hypothetical protein